MHGKQDGPYESPNLLGLAGPTAKKLQTSCPVGKASHNGLESVNNLGNFKANNSDLCALHSNCFNLAEAYRKDNLCGRGDRSIWRTTPGDFGQWGIGVELYFRFTRTAGIVSCILGLLFLPLLILCRMGDALSSIDLSTAGRVALLLSKYTVSNMGDFVDDTLNSSYILTGSTNISVSKTLGSGDFPYDERVVVLFGNNIDIRHVTLVTGILDSIAAFVIFLTAAFFEFVVIPRVVMRHRAEYITPDIYSVYVDCLPKRLFGGGGQEKYPSRLHQHFAMFLAAQVTTKTAKKKMKVIDIHDKGGKEKLQEVQWKFCCCRRHPGFDHKGRRIGRILQKNAGHVVVQWSGPPDVRKYRLSNGEVDGELLDACMLWRLESFDLEPAPLSEAMRGVFSVHLQRDFGSMLAKMKANAKREDRKFEAKLRTVHQKSKVRRVSTVIQMIGARSNEDDLLDPQGICMEERDVVGAFVIFNHVRLRNFVYAEYKYNRTPFRLLLRLTRLTFSGECLRVSEAPPPSDVFWENLDFPFSRRTAQTLKVFLICSIICCGVIMVIAVARSKAESSERVTSLTCSGGVNDHQDCICALAGYQNVIRDEPTGLRDRCSDWLGKRSQSYLWWSMSSSVSMVTIVGAGFIVGHLARVERPRSITALNKSIMNMSTIMYVLALGTIRVFINAKLPFNILSLFGNGKYTDLVPEWYVFVGSSVMLTLGLNSLYPVCEVLRGPSDYCWLWFRRSRQKLITDLLDLYTPSAFPFALRHAEQLAQLFACLTFCGGMPVLSVYLIITFWLHYWCDKYVFLRSSKTPPRYTHHLILHQVRLVQCAVWMHCSFSVWVYANRSAPSHRFIGTGAGDAVGINLDIQGGEGSGLRLLDKMFMVSSLPSTFVGSIVFISFALRILVWSIGSYLRQIVPSKKWLKFIPGVSLFEVEDEEDDSESTFANELQAMRRRGIKTHYDVQHMPGFEFLLEKPEEKSNDANDKTQEMFGLTLSMGHGKGGRGMDSMTLQKHFDLHKRGFANLGRLYSSNSPSNTKDTANNAPVNSPNMFAIREPPAAIIDAGDMPQGHLHRAAKQRPNDAPATSNSSSRARSPRSRSSPAAATSPREDENALLLQVPDQGRFSGGKPRPKSNRRKPRSALPVSESDEGSMDLASSRSFNLASARQSSPRSPNQLGRPTPSDSSRTHGSTRVRRGVASTAHPGSLELPSAAHEAQEVRRTRSSNSARRPKQKLQKQMDTDEILADQHKDDLAAARERLGLRSTRNELHSDGTHLTGVRAKLRGKGKGKGEGKASNQRKHRSQSIASDPGAVDV